MSVLVSTKYNKLGSINELASELAKIVDENTIFVCVGTDRIIGDSLGPIVGSLLQDRIPNKVYGTVENPVHALNVNKIGKTIKEEYKGNTIIAIDACVGITIPKGDIRLRNTPVKPGKGACKELDEIGDYSIAGIVYEKLPGDTARIINDQLGYVRLDFISKMAKMIVESIVLALNMQKELIGDLYEVEE